MGSGIGLFYYLRIIFAMTRHFDEPGSERSSAGSIGDRGAIVVLTLVLIGFGVYPMPLIELAREAVASFGLAANMLGSGP